MNRSDIGRIAFLLLMFAGVPLIYALSEPPMDSQERKTMMEAQAKAAERRTKVSYVNHAMRRTELQDDEFLHDGREDVRSLGIDLLKCWTDMDKAEAAREKAQAEYQRVKFELDGIKQILLDRKP